MNAAGKIRAKAIPTTVLDKYDLTPPFSLKIYRWKEH
jgi:hypothetical protein